MEKQSVKGTSGFIKRLLIPFSFLLLFTLNLFSNSFNADTQNSGYYTDKSLFEEIELLKFKPLDNQELLVNNDIQFEVKIPKLRPEHIQILKNNNSEDNTNFTLKSIKKFRNRQEEGTKIQLWYNFSREGSYTLPPLRISIFNRIFEITFDTITISQDPMKMMPRIVIIFSNGISLKSDDILGDQPLFSAITGEELLFTVYLQYAKQLIKFDFDIPKNSIYKQTETYKITEEGYTEESISNNLIPVADFKWTGLKQGLQYIPKIKITAAGYNNDKIELILPEAKINFISRDDNKNDNSDDNKSQENKHNLFEEAFLEPEKEIIKEQTAISNDNLEKLADLYSKEKNSIFSKHKYKKERKSLEESLGLPVSKKILNRGILYIYIILFIVMSVLLFFAIKNKSKVRIFTISILLSISLILIIPTAYEYRKLYGITRECTVYSIPEKKAEASSKISSGNVVEITENTEDWYYIHLGETRGWCLKENIIIIK